ncbi:STAS domain-containing protein [Streptomyces sp. NBC_00582]|uniref:STAS domain-containing protein n=1 Tax=Streptomyces sp. NBC_00582 TaxID=2975783 RepID=UPI0010630AF6|nr:STAS domain-containing protein [Streptomyces sp. NBC_00582]WUB66910.1 STAS domain-containing protein [Streptomyces sp. NBC_00582]
MSSASGADSGPPDPTTPHAADLPRLTQQELRGAWVVALHGAFDANSAPLLTEALQTGARTHSAVVVDAADVTFADSTVLNTLLTVNRTTDLRLARPAPPLRRVLELTGADTVLDIRSTVEDAVTR